MPQHSWIPTAFCSLISKYSKKFSYFVLKTLAPYLHCNTGLCFLRLEINGPWTPFGPQNGFGDPYASKWAGLIKTILALNGFHLLLYSQWGGSTVVLGPERRSTVVLEPERQSTAKQRVRPTVSENAAVNSKVTMTKLTILTKLVTVITKHGK